MNRRTAACVFMLLAAMSLVTLGGCRSSASKPSDALMARLDRGVNLSDWWTGPAPDAAQPRSTVPTAEDFARIRGWGMRHVRVPVDLARLAAPGGGRLRGEAIEALAADLEQIADADLAIILAVQMPPQAKARVLNNNGAFKAFVADWQRMAEALDSIPQDLLVLELLNEPETDDPQLWWARQQALAAAVREVAPRHTLMLTGAHYSDIDDLTRLDPVRDGNVIYSFHFYTPHNFTHQGAGWGWAMWRQFTGLPYPSSLEAVRPMANRASNAARPHIEHYGREQWDADKISPLIGKAAAWGKRHGAAVHCTEFGVIGGAPPQGRTRWLADVRTRMEQSGIGWTVWDYAGRFALVSPARQPHRDALQALGLSP